MTYLWILQADVDDEEEDLYSGEVKLDDLPAKLDLSESQAIAVDSQAQPEDVQVDAMQAVLESMKVSSELAGDANAIKEPGEYYLNGCWKFCCHILRFKAVKTWMIPPQTAT